MGVVHVDDDAVGILGVLELGAGVVVEVADGVSGGVLRTLVASTQSRYLPESSTDRQ